MPPILRKAFATRSDVSPEISSVMPWSPPP